MASSSSLSSIRVVKSERGRDNVLLNDFTFRKAYYHAAVGGWKWRCTNKKCAASVYLDAALRLVAEGPIKHNHLPASRKTRSTFPDTTTAPVSPDAELVKRAPADGVEQLQNRKTKTKRVAVERRKQRQKKATTEGHFAQESQQLLVDDGEFALDECDSNTVFVSDFESHGDIDHINRSSSSAGITIDRSSTERFDPLSDTLATSAFPSACDVSPKQEFVGVKAEPIDLDMDDGDDGDDDECCFLNEEFALIRNVRVHPAPKTVYSSGNAAYHARHLRKSRPSTFRGYIDLSHPLDSFFVGIAQSVKNLSTVNQIRAKQMIANVVTKLEIDEIVNRKSF